MSDSFVTPWTVALQAPLSMGFPRQEYWNRLPFPSPGYLLDPGTKLMSPTLTVGFFTTEPPAAAATESLQSCPTLCNPIDGSPLGSPVPGVGNP